MNTKSILVSILMIGVVAVAAGAGTLAWFSDVETSSGNTFTAGELDLKIDYDGYYNMQVNEGEPNAGHWDETDLIEGTHKFFDLTDVKPGDYGEGTISLHVDNDAWFRLKTDNIVNHDNGCNKPECIAEGGVWDPATGVCAGASCSDPGSDTSGELGDYLSFSIWIDDGDNIYDVEKDYLIVYDVKANEQSTEWIYLANYGGYYFEACETYYFGVAWCVGDMTIEGDGTITCDGSNVGNIIQSDSISSDATYEVQQHRNNPNPVWL